MHEVKSDWLSLLAKIQKRRKKEKEKEKATHSTIPDEESSIPSN